MFVATNQKKRRNSDAIRPLLLSTPVADIDNDDEEYENDLIEYASNLIHQYNGAESSTATATAKIALSNDTPQKRQSMNNSNNNKDKISLEYLFVCKFDVKIGNMIEHVIDINQDSNNVQSSSGSGRGYMDTLRGIEFKSLPAGIHRISSDHVLFKHGELTGLACVDHKRTDNADERYSRIRSIGVLCLGQDDGTIMKRYYSLLKDLISKCNESPALSEEHKQLMSEAIVPSSHQNVQPSKDGQVEKFGSLVSLLHSLDNGAIMTVWKSLLLGRRVLFYSDVPLGPMCSKVSACQKLLLSASDKQDMGGEFERHIQQQPRYLYYVCINDMPELSSNKGINFVACTTDRIFDVRRSKNQPTKKTNNSHNHKRKRRKVDDTVCDLFVNNQTINFENPEDAHIFQITNSDLYHTEEMRYRISTIDNEELQESGLLDYFSYLNIELLNVLKALCARDSAHDDGIVSTDHFIQIGKVLNLCTNDIHFMQSLIDEFGGDVELELPQSKSSLFCC